MRIVSCGSYAAIPGGGREEESEEPCPLFVLLSLSLFFFFSRRAPSPFFQRASVFFFVYTISKFDKNTRPVVASSARRLSSSSFCFSPLSSFHFFLFFVFFLFFFWINLISLPLTNVDSIRKNDYQSTRPRCAPTRRRNTPFSFRLSFSRAHAFYYNITRIYRQTVSSVPSHAFRTAETGGVLYSTRVSSLTSPFTLKRD